MAYGRIKTEHAGAKNMGQDKWTPRAWLKRASSKLRRRHLTEEDDPVLARIWNNGDDAIYDEMGEE